MSFYLYLGDVMNEKYILEKIKPYLNDEGIIREVDFNQIFCILSLREQYKVIDILIKNNIDIDYNNISINRFVEKSKQKNTVPNLYKLTNEQLCVMYQQGVESALEALIIKNMQLVSSRVQRHIKVYNHKLDEDDLLQCGVIGMINAVKKFDVKMETRFTTYAIWWIDQSILRNIIDYGFAIRIPVYRFQEVGDLMKVFKAYPHSSKEQIYELLKEERGLSRDRFEELIGLLHNILSMASLNRYVGEDEDSELGDFVVDEVSSTVEEMVEEKEMKRILNDVLETITEREEKIIRLRFGLDDGKERTLEQVGNVFGVTRERIRQIEAKALRKLRHPTRSKKLRSFLYGD